MDVSTPAVFNRAACTGVCVLMLISMISHFSHCTALSAANITCTRWPNVTVTYRTTWSERCRQCECMNDGQTECTQPTCALAYHPYQEDRCEQWSSNSCCCERLVCRHHGQTYNIGEEVPLHEDRPCTVCTCIADPKVMNCVDIDCGTVDCVDPVVRTGNCCLSCPNGQNCRLPPLEWRDNGEPSTTVPIPYNKTRIIFSSVNTWLAWSCTCKMPGSDAECSRQARLFHMSFPRD